MIFDPNTVSYIILLAACAGIGASIGSFLNVCIYRIPIGLSVNEPRRSFCPVCRHQVEARDNIPVLSWLWLRGKCRHCKAPISIWYFLIELFAGLGAAIAFQKNGILGTCSFLLFYSLATYALRTARGGLRIGPRLLAGIIFATLLIFIQRQTAPLTISTLVCIVAGWLIALRWLPRQRIDWSLKVVIILCALVCGWVGAIAGALLIFVATSFEKERFPGIEDALLLLGISVGPLVIF
jgi:prepilin signal peptidase PulO-like enzyme (type II secretory pathway)